MKNVNSIILVTGIYISVLLISTQLCGEYKTRLTEDGVIEYYNVNNSFKPTRYPRTRTINIKYKSLIQEASLKYDVDPKLVYCIIKVESDFNPNAVSKAGAQGLMQLMPGTAEMYKIKNPFEPRENIYAGVQHLSVLLRQCDGNEALALAAYHAGLSRVRIKNQVPDIEATINYVNIVMYYYTGEKNAAEKTPSLRMFLNEDGVMEITN
jgi:soluble lytic murein transglycosylase-like protein